ncbi:hypothetical protein Acsp02_44070 [Actinoplanes sp. NBRC 103695]|nr:hypothetical protein Acsp02_44070 [Actinoplanes sp. NBRC 103695]
MSGNDAAAADGDQLAQAGTAESHGLRVVARGLRVGEGSQKFESPAAPVGVKPLWGRGVKPLWGRGVKPLWGSGHGAEAAERGGVRQDRVRCATKATPYVYEMWCQTWTFTTAASPGSSPIGR